nr:immunoglobulin heavy chain junction region [Macaca mulatta]MOV89297.1 immunoglobulin heavy chain junction region [Macaca mulatta]
CARESDPCSRGVCYSGARERFFEFW